MKIYEGVILVDSRKANRDWDSVLAHLNGVLQKSGATIRRVDKWVERKLAFPIKKQTRGVYVLAYFETPDEEGVIGEIYRQTEISDTILRALIVRIEAVPEQAVPAPMSEDEERRGRQRGGPAEVETVRTPAAVAAPEETGSDSASDEDAEAADKDAGETPSGA